MAALSVPFGRGPLPSYGCRGNEAGESRTRLAWSADKHRAEFNKNTRRGRARAEEVDSARVVVFRTSVLWGGALTRYASPQPIECIPQVKRVNIALRYVTTTLDTRLGNMRQPFAADCLQEEAITAKQGQIEHLEIVSRTDSV